jgi:dihydrofolate reductase
MKGGTTFYFITDGIHSALDQARHAANGKDVRIGGGPYTINEFLRARLIDQLHIAIAPVLLGAGERLFGDINLREAGYRCVEHAASKAATHVVIRNRESE